MEEKIGKHEKQTQNHLVCGGGTTPTLSSALTRGICAGLGQRGRGCAALSATGRAEHLGGVNDDAQAPFPSSPGSRDSPRAERRGQVTHMGICTLTGFYVLLCLFPVIKGNKKNQERLFQPRRVSASFLNFHDGHSIP